MASTRLYNRSSGFSLIELLVVVTILAVLAALAAPQFSESIKRYRIASVRDDLMGSLQLARTEAIRRGVQVVLRRTATCFGVALTDADEWSCGWEIFVDTNGNGTLNSGEPIIQRSTVPQNYIVMHTNLGSTVVMNVWGQATGVGQKFVIAPPLPEGISGKSTTTVCMNSGGRLRKLESDATCP